MQTQRAARPAKLPARPEPVDIDLARTALVVVDMQNAFVRGAACSTGRLAHRRRARRHRAEPPAARRRCARPASSVVYVKMSYNPDLSNAGGPDSPNYHKEIGMVLMRQHPEYTEQLRHRGHLGRADRRGTGARRGRTGRPQAALQRVRGHEPRPRAQDPGQQVPALHRRRHQHLCRRDAHGRLLPRLLAHPRRRRLLLAVPAGHGRGAVWNVENLFGWVTSVDDVLATVGQAPAAIAEEAAT